jgi:hypothetical protein
MKKFLLILTILVTVVSCNAANLTMYGLVNREAKMDGKVDFYCINNAFVEMKKQKIVDYSASHDRYGPTKMNKYNDFIAGNYEEYLYKIEIDKEINFTISLDYQNKTTIFSHEAFSFNLEKRKDIPEKITPIMQKVEKILNQKCSIPTFEEVKN